MCDVLCTSRYMRMQGPSREKAGMPIITLETKIPCIGIRERKSDLAKQNSPQLVRVFDQRACRVSKDDRAFPGPR